MKYTIMLVAVAVAAVFAGNGYIQSASVDAQAGVTTPAADDSGKAGPVTVKKDGTGNYTTITAALTAGKTDIIVYPGWYAESLTITGTNVKLRSYEGPYLTTIAGECSQTVVTFTATARDCVLSGFYITGGYQGVAIENGSKVKVTNCVIGHNCNHGLAIGYVDNDSPITTADIYNNCFVENVDAGILITSSNNDWSFVGCYTIENNIFVGNQRYAIRAERTDGWKGIYTRSGKYLVIDYNDYVSNTPAKYGPGEHPVTGGSHDDLAEDPLFISAPTNLGIDVRLQTAPDVSPCRGAGDPGVAFMNPDGTRNDMGVYGGPDCATFYESPTDGPIVRNVTVEPGPVTQGDPFTVQATVAVR